MIRYSPLLVKPKKRICSADPIAGPGLLMAVPVVMDPKEGLEIAEFDLLDGGAGCLPCLSVSTHFSGAFSPKYLPVGCSTYQVFHFTKISQAFCIPPTRFLGNNEGGHRTICRESSPLYRAQIGKDYAPWVRKSDGGSVGRINKALQRYC